MKHSDLLNQMDRKANEFGYVTEIEVYENQVKKYPLLTDVDVYLNEMKEDDSPACLNFEVLNLPMEFILVTNMGEFLVFREGYDYARYIAKLVLKKKEPKKYQIELTEDDLNEVCNSGRVDAFTEFVLEKAREKGWK